MISPEDFLLFVKSSFSFLIAEFQFEFWNETINGTAYYDVKYRDKNNVISISIESSPNYYQVMLFKLEDGQLPDYDDKRKSIHLNELNDGILHELTKEEFKKNNEYFAQIDSKDETQRMILKSAKDLRLCLLYSDDLIGPAYNKPAAASRGSWLGKLISSLNIRTNRKHKVK